MYRDKNKIIALLDALKPNNIESLVNSVVMKTDMNKKNARNLILKMIDENDISIKNPKKYKTFTNFIIDIDSLWFWLILLSLVLYNTITIISINFKDILFFRYILGGIFTYFIPGYALVNTIYLTPNNNQIEQIALSVILSIVLTPATSIILNYTPWGITLTTISISISILSITIAILGQYRRYTEHI